MKLRVVSTVTLIVLAGCAARPADRSPSTPPPESGDAAVVTAVSTPQPVAPENPLETASELLLRSRTAPPAERADYRLRATAALLRAGRVDQALQVLESVDVSGLDVIFAAREQVLRAHVALRQNQPASALRLLTPWVNRPGLSPQLNEQIWYLRARANLQLDQRFAAARDLVARERYLADPDEIRGNQQQLWHVLNLIGQEELAQFREAVSDPDLVAWIDLAVLHIQHGHDPFRLSNEIAQWRALYPGHAANQFLQERVRVVSTASVAAPRRIALLLPLASDYGRAAQAVHDGFMAMHAADGDPYKPDVRVYDIGAESALAPVYYRLAVQEGADLVIGPLGKQAVTTLTASDALSVPTVLLGSPSQHNAILTNAFQFDLSPEQEAEQVAVRAYLDGHRTAAILYPETPWGERLREAFNRRWEELGGVMAESRPYVDNRTDFTAPIKELLNVDNSEGRKAQLSVVLKTKLEFQPRRRQDIDFVFLASKTASARLLKPQINFFQGHDLPVYSTSHVYAGRPDPINDADLNGIVFGDMPWMLATDGRIQNARQYIQGDWPFAYTPLDRLFALGMDAYAIIPFLNRLRANPGMLIEGVSASLSMSGNGRIIRQLTWARFEGGRPTIEGIVIDTQRMSINEIGSTTRGVSPEIGPTGGTQRP